MTNKIIKTWRDPYEAGFSPTTPTKIELQPGLTVLVGCNGAGKSTLLLNIEEYCKDNKIPCHLYDNLQSGGSNAISSLFYDGNYGESAYLMSASEGECIKANVGRDSSLYKDFFKNGYINNRHNKMARIFANKDELKRLDERYQECRDRFLLFDAVDSGLSVDSIVEIKEMFNAILEDAATFHVNIYIIIAANEYELARNSNCFDVNKGTYITFKDYEEYRTFIIKSRQLKEKRLEKQSKWRAQKKQKEISGYIQVKTKTEEQRNKLLTKYGDKELSWSEKYALSDIDRKVKNYLSDCRFLGEEEAEKIWLEQINKINEDTTLL